jgi:hypothetical protein
MATDPRYHILDMIDGITVTKDNGVNNASILYIYEGSQEDLYNVFFDDDYDVVVTVGIADSEVASGDQREIQDAPVHFTGSHKVTVTALDKFDVLGNKVCTATKMNDQLKTTIAAAAQQVGYTVKIQNMRPEGGRARRKIGGLYFWIRAYRIEYFEINP